MGKINKYFKSVFSIKTIATVSVIAMILAGVYYLNMTSTTGKMWGVEQSTVLIVIYALAGLTLISVYYFNVKKSGWLLAILTLIIQTISAIIIAPFLILYFFNKMMNAIVGGNSDSTKSANSPSRPNSSTKSANSPNRPNNSLPTNEENIIKPWGTSIDKGWEYRNGIIKPWGASIDKGWEYKDGIIKPWGASIDKGWEYKDGIIKPWGASTDKGWEYKDGIIKPWGVSIDKGWEYRNGIIKPWGASIDKGWEVKGNIPIPVIAKAIGIIK